MTRDVFLQTFSGFAQTDPVLVDAKLAEAAAMMGGTVAGGPSSRWGSFAPFGRPPTFADIAHGNCAAMLLIEDPLGAAGRFEAKGETTSRYQQKWERACMTIAAGPLVSGGRRAIFPWWG